MPTRREVLAGLLGAPALGAALASCDDGNGRPARIEGRLLGPDMEAGHQLREPPDLARWQSAPSRDVDIAILGGGAAGLSAAWRLMRRGVTDFELFELEGRPGGTSMGGESGVTAYPWGAHYLPLPGPEHGDLITLLEEMGAIVGRDEAGLPQGAEQLLVREPDERLFVSGQWYRGLFPAAGASSEDRQQLRAFMALVGGYVDTRDEQGKRAFTIPLLTSSESEQLRALDTISAAAFLDRHALTSPRLRWWVEYACRDDYGLTLETTSAWAMLWYFASRTPAAGEEAMELITWPEGNSALIKHLAAAAGPRVTASCMAVHVEPGDVHVTVRLLDLAQGLPQTIRAKHVVLALPRFVVRRIVPAIGAEEASDEAFRYGPWLVANLHLRERPAGRGFEPAWDNVIYESPSLGYVSATHQRGRDFGPTVWTYYLPLTDDDERAARQRLLEPTWREWTDLILHDLTRAHPGLRDVVTRVDVWRWGHGMVQPRVGTLFARSRRLARAPRGRMHFAHSDLSGVAIFEEAFHHGVRAADEVVAARAAPGPKVAFPANWNHGKRPRNT